MRLVIDKHIIDTPILTILTDVRKSLNDGRLKVIKQKGNNVMITCPFHKDGMENRPSCQVYDSDDSDLERGTFHCFTCGYKAPLIKAIADIYDVSQEESKQFLIDNYSNTTIEELLELPEIQLNHNKQPVETLSEDVLKQFDYYHPYMWQRKLTKEIVDKFRIGYDPKTNCLTFPVYNEKNQLIMITRRSVDTKMFNLESNIEKPVYLLNYLLNNNIKTAYICESQINALTCHVYGKPGVALFGTGTQHQYDILRKSGIRNFILLFDGDSAGRKGAERFKKNMPSDIFITDIIIPAGKDVNDLTREEFYQILEKSS